MSTEGISFTIVENAVSEELPKGDLKKAWERLERRWNPKTREDKVEVYDTFLLMFRLCSCGTKPQRSENHHFVMTSSWEPQCHHDIIMRTPRITGKPKFSWSGGP